MKGTICSALPTPMTITLPPKDMLYEDILEVRIDAESRAL